MDAANTSFVGYFAGMPARHGMTMGELARLFNAQNKIGANLTVVAMEDWRRGDWFDSTGLPWVNPSPNMRSLNAATLYPGLCLLESGNVFRFQIAPPRAPRDGNIRSSAGSRKDRSGGPGAREESVC